MRGPSSGTQNGEHHQNSSQQSSAARRRLFQEPENNETVRNEEKILLELLAETDREAAKRKWNFDFEREVPLEGDWEWEKV